MSSFGSLPAANLVLRPPVCVRCHNTLNRTVTQSEWRQLMAIISANASQHRNGSSLRVSENRVMKRHSSHNQHSRRCMPRSLGKLLYPRVRHRHTQTMVLRRTNPGHTALTTNLDTNPLVETWRIFCFSEGYAPPVL